MVKWLMVNDDATPLKQYRIYISSGEMVSSSLAVELNRPFYAFYVQSCRYQIAFKYDNFKFTYTFTGSGQHSIVTFCQPIQRIE
jgi:hypothetical protein